MPLKVSLSRCATLRVCLFLGRSLDLIGGSFKTLLWSRSALQGLRIGCFRETKSSHWHSHLGFGRNFSLFLSEMTSAAARSSTLSEKVVRKQHFTERTFCSVTDIVVCIGNEHLVVPAQESHQRMKNVVVLRNIICRYRTMFVGKERYFPYRSETT